MSGQLDALHAQEDQVQRESQIRNTRSQVNITLRNTHTPQPVQDYRFHAIQTIPGLKDEARARSILESFASDPGILAVMKKHKYDCMLMILLGLV